MPELQAFPASAASSLVSGYCSDFIDLAATMAQTLEQVTMRGLDIGSSKEQLARVEHGMRNLADAIGDVLAKLDAGKPRIAPRSPSPAGSSPAAVSPAPAKAGPSKVATTTSAAPSRVVPVAPVLASQPKLPAERASLPARPAPDAPTARPAAAVPSAPKVVGGGSASASAATGTTPSTANGELQGSTDTLPMRSVFQFLGRTRKTGHLHVTMGKEKVRFEFVDGCMVGTSSTASPADELLGAILVELRVVSAAQIQSHVKQHGDGRQRLGAALVAARLVTESQLADAVDRQTAKRFQRTVAQKQASYVFEPEAEHTERGIRIRSRSTPDASLQ